MALSDALDRTSISVDPQALDMQIAFISALIYG